MLIVVIVAIDVIDVIGVIGVIDVISRRGRLRTRTLHSQTVCSKLPAGETPASPVGFSLLFAWGRMETAPPCLTLPLPKGGGVLPCWLFVGFLTRVVFVSFSRLTRGELLGRRAIDGIGAIGAIVAIVAIGGIDAMFFLAGGDACAPGHRSMPLIYSKS